jgi:NADPH:quinone reductase-like Zn-dependent oxidoreductase
LKNKRIVVAKYGGPDVIHVIEEECPEPMNGEVRVKILAAGVSLPDIMAREGIHPETPKVPFTPGWDLVGVVEKIGTGISGIEIGEIVSAMPIHGAYTEFICLPKDELVPVPPGLDAGEAVSLILNYITAYQMMHRSVQVKAKQCVLIHGASGGVGTALLQLGSIAGLDMYGTCSARGAQVVSELGGVPIDYRNKDFVTEVKRLTGDGVDVAFDPIGGSHLWNSRKTLRNGGKVVGYGLISSIRGEGLKSNRPGSRQRFRGTALFGMYIAGGWILPGKKRIVPYSIQTLKRLKPDMFRQDLTILFNLLKEKKIKPIIAHRFKFTDAKQAHELLEKGGVIGKIVLDSNV